MPLEDLDAYRSDSGSSIQSRNSETVPKIPQGDSDSNATEAESNGEPSEEQIFDRQSDDSDQHTPAQKSKRCCSPADSSADDDVVGPSDSESFLSERDEAKALQERLQAPLTSMGACVVMEQGSCGAR